jgi:hypothetical protein
VCRRRRSGHDRPGEERRVARAPPPATTRTARWSTPSHPAAATAPGASSAPIVSICVDRPWMRSTAPGCPSIRTTSAVCASGPDAAPATAKAATSHPKLGAPAARSSEAPQPAAPQTISGRRRIRSSAAPATGSTTAATVNSAWKHQPTWTTDRPSRARSVGIRTIMRPLVTSSVNLANSTRTVVRSSRSSRRSRAVRPNLLESHANIAPSSRSVAIGGRGEPAAPAFGRGHYVEEITWGCGLAARWTSGSDDSNLPRRPRTARVSPPYVTATSTRPLPYAPPSHRPGER